MTSSYLLVEAMSSRDDVSNQLLSREAQELDSAMTTSAASSSHSAGSYSDQQLSQSYQQFVYRAVKSLYKKLLTPIGTICLRCSLVLMFKNPRQLVAQGGHPAGQGAQSSQSSQSAHQPQKQQQPQVAQQSGCQRFRPRGQQFKNKSGSSSSGSGSSSSSGSRAEFCGYCGGKHPSTQCFGVQGSYNLCGQYGHFARVCPSAGSQQAVASPQGCGGQSRDRSPQFQQPRIGETQFRPFQQPGQRHY
ncbi:hypothetical protein F511_12642 [Dorcoceras hygrometricum]|uniref:CCHC-type domain-containing protein n=1 Tax=Dorcoceras hygrometricum TaxID=472368 RepID=A0A2Z7CHH0_9LAMI|nr:hypothetical protein F511_12642 [Dorcoceras hygrometricum]